MELTRPTAHTSWNFTMKLDFYHPSEEISSFFANDFVVAEDSTSNTLKAISSDFADFRRLKVLRNRFETFGYCEMFKRMLSIEDLTVRKALNELSMTDRYVTCTSIPHHFVVYFEGKTLSEKLGFNHLVLTPMSKYRPGENLSSKDESRIFNQIIKIDGTRVVFQKPRRFYISISEKYHVQLVENRVSIRLAFMALDRIANLGLESFFISFDESTLKSLVQKDRQVFNVQSINHSIGTNKSQISAVKNIVHRTSFPAPYIVFGPPGKNVVLCSSQIHFFYLQERERRAH